MRLVLFGNHTCGNRGDSAILRGLISGVETLLPDAHVEIVSRYPTSSTYLLGRKVDADPFSRWHSQRTSFFGRLTNDVVRWVIPVLMASAIRTRWKWPCMLLPAAMKVEIERLRQFDIAIQVGGSFFVDLYGPTQFEYSFASILASRPLLLIGHSMGPFEGGWYRWLSATLLTHASVIALREADSRTLIEQSRLPTARIVQGSDTAWLVPVPVTRISIDKWLPARRVERPLIGVTLRELAPFAMRLATTQVVYESAIAVLINTLIEDGYDVVAASACTGIDSYHRDDRMVALRVAEGITRREHFHTVMGEPNDIELGQLLANCILVIGTRLHSAIIAMNFGTPALAISYEHKSIGVMRQMDLDELSKPIQSLLDGTLTEHVLDLLQDLERLRQRTNTAVARERQRAISMLTSCLSTGREQSY